MTTKEDLEEIYLERERFLLNTDELLGHGLLEQILEDDDNIMFPPSRENNISLEPNISLIFV